MLRQAQEAVKATPERLCGPGGHGISLPESRPTVAGRARIAD